LPLSIDLPPTQWRAPDTNRHVARAATRRRAVNAESPDDVRCPEARVQVGARHGIACVCPTVHNTFAQKTRERTTQFFRSVRGDTLAIADALLLAEYCRRVHRGIR
jgi:hypothetical protein